MRQIRLGLVFCLLGAACDEAPPPPVTMRRDAGPCELRVESCDGVDNDCNGAIDDTGIPEFCDGVDDDCDDRIDEGACAELGVPGGTGWILAPTSSGVIVADDGSLTLEPPRVDIVQPALWIANTDEGSVSRLDPMTGRETARYASVDVTSGLPEGRENLPSRTAIDQRLDAYVANRAFGRQASVTKIAGSLERCVDRDLDGIVETSSDLDGNGTISLEPALGEYLGPSDECLLWTVAVGSADGIARALAVGLAGPDGEAGDVWVGLFNEQTVLVLSHETGAQIASVPIGLNPYGAVAGADGRIWLTSGPARSGALVSVDPSTFAVERIPLPAGVGTYGISLDGLGRVILAAQSNGRTPWHGVAAYDPGSDRWSQSPDLHVSTSMPNPLRGISASADAVWLAGRTPSEESALYELSVADLSLVHAHTIRGADEIVGVGVAFDGRIWGIAKGSDAAYRLDRTTGVIDSFDVGHAPYTYSDFTGFGLNGLLGATGLHRVVVEGCDGAVWTGLRVDADIPENTAVQLSVRSAETVPGLAAAPWVGVFHPPSPSLAVSPGPIPAGRLLEISLRLTSTALGVVPRVRAITAMARCDSVG